jgi:hypothetical protein
MPVDEICRKMELAMVCQRPTGRRLDAPRQRSNGVGWRLPNSRCWAIRECTRRAQTTLNRCLRLATVRLVPACEWCRAAPGCRDFENGNLCIALS